MWDDAVKIYGNSPRKLLKNTKNNSPMGNMDDPGKARLPIISLYSFCNEMELSHIKIIDLVFSNQ